MKKCVGIMLVVYLTTLPIVSSARSVRETNYRYDQIWSTAVRFLRVDSGFAVLEQDKGTGYVLFEYREGGRTLNGAVEMIPIEKNGSETIQLGIRIQGMPTYVENVLMDKLVRKLKDEYGEPPPVRRIENPSVASEAKAEGADSKDKKKAKDKTAKDDINIDEDD